MAGAIVNHEHHSHSGGMPQSTRSWAVVLFASLFFFYEFIQMNMFSSLGTELMLAFHIDATGLGKLGSTYFIANLLFLFPAGILLDRFSTKKIILWSLGFCFLGTFFFSLTHAFWLAMACRFFTGIGSAFCFLCCVRLASRWFEPKMMALVTGVVITVAMVGGMVAQTPLRLLINHFGWREALRFDALLGFGILLLIWFGVQNYPEDTHGKITEQRSQLHALGFWRSTAMALLRIQNWLAGLYACLMNLPIYLLGALWGSMYCTQVQHLSATDSSFVTSMIFLGTIIGSPLVGRISDALGYRKKPMIWGVFLSCVVFAPLMMGIQLSLAELMAIFFLLGLTTSTQVLSYPMVAESNPISLTATAVSVVSFTVIGGGAVFQPLFGYLMDSAYHGVVTTKTLRVYTPATFHHAMLIMPVSFVISLIALFFLKETRCQQNASTEV